MIRSTCSTRCFGFQRTGDAIWAAADQMARGFLIGATAGRTTLTGEGLQHADGTRCSWPQPTRPWWLRPGLRLRDRAHRARRPAAHARGGPENVLYYLTVYNEPIPQPAQPADADVEGILRGMHLVARPISTRATTDPEPRSWPPGGPAVGDRGPAVACAPIGAWQPRLEL